MGTPEISGTFGTFRIENTLKTAPGATWYQAEHEEFGPVRLKVLDEGAKEDPEILQRHVLEGKAMDGIAHKNLLRILKSGAFEGRYYMATQPASETTLHDLVENEGPLSVKRAVDIVMQILEGLATAHENKVTHWMLSPETVLIDADDRVQVFGFGAAHAGGGLAKLELMNRLERIGPWGAPEMVLRPQKASELADVYSVGAIFYYLLTGEPVHRETQFEKLAEAMVSGRPFVPSSVRGGLPRVVDQIILKALERKPIHRFRSAHYMRRALEMAKAGETPEIQLTGRVRYREWPWSLRMVLLILILQIFYLIVFDPARLTQISLNIQKLFAG